MTDHESRGSRTETWNREQKPGNRRPQRLRFPEKAFRSTLDLRLDRA
jgi:hypothetical protein